MAANPAVIPASRNPELHPVRISAFPGLRALAWNDDVLYASSGYSLLKARIQNSTTNWETVGIFRPSFGRTLTSSFRLTSRLRRDGFHALAVLRSGHVIGAVPHAIVTLKPGESEFRTSHRVLRGTRPLHFAVAPGDNIFWGEYFDNPQRDEVHIYASTDRGGHWDVAHIFAKGAIRHVHNIVYDEFENCFWVLTGDEASECRILRASCDFRSVDVVLSGSQQTRSAALVPTRHALYFSSDTPLEQNHIYRLDRRGNLTTVAALGSSSIYGCRVGEAIFFSTMVEPSAVNPSRSAAVFGSADGEDWQQLAQWKKDAWPMGLFQYGNAFLPDGRNTSGILAVTTIAVTPGDLETSLWRF